MDLFQADQFQRNDIKLNKNIRIGTEDPLNRPRHRIQGTCIRFQECPLCYKCRAFNAADVSCLNCELKNDSICNKEKHTEHVLNVMIRRERIELN